MTGFGDTTDTGYCSSFAGMIDPYCWITGATGVPNQIPYAPWVSTDANGNPVQNGGLAGWIVPAVALGIVVLLVVKR